MAIEKKIPETKLLINEVIVHKFFMVMPEMVRKQIKYIIKEKK